MHCYDSAQKPQDKYVDQYQNFTEKRFYFKSYSKLVKIAGNTKTSEPLWKPAYIHTGPGVVN